METDVVDKFKASGNDAFKKGKLDKALDFYQKAIEAGESLSKDFSKLAILHSNSAQVYLQQKKFDQAISAASTSLEHDPGFSKSLLRRGIANVELKEHEKATADLKSFLRMEPNSQQGVSYLRKVFSFAKLKDGLQKSFIGHYLRRALIKWNQVSASSCFDPLFARKLFRLTVISLKSAQGMKQFWKDGRICSPDTRGYAFTLLPWFVVKRMKTDILCNILFITISKLMMMVIIQVVQPTGLSLQLEESLAGLELSSLCKFEQIYCMSNFLFEDSIPNQTPIKKFNHVSKFLTDLAYFDEVPRISIPNLNVLVILPTRTVRTKFINDWKKFKWPIKRLEFRSAAPNFSSFASFNGVLSHDLTDLRIVSKDSNSKGLQANLFQQLIEKLAILKRCFPNLKNLVAGIEVVFDTGKSFSSQNFLKPYFKYLTTLIDTKKIEWCSEPKVCVKIVSQGETSSDVLKNMKFVEKTVNECRKEMKELTFIRFNGPSMNKLGVISDMCAYSRIEMEANRVWFDISFHSL